MANHTYANVAVAGDGASEGMEQGARSREWLVFWCLVVPQIAFAGGVLAIGLPGLVLPIACFPVLAASVANPFVGLATLFAILPFDDLLAVYGTSFSLSKVVAIFVVLGFVIRAGRSGYSLFPVEPVTRATTALGLVMLLTGFWSEHPIATAVSAVTPVLLAGLALIGVQLIDSRRRLEIVLTSLLLSGFVVGVLLTFGVVGLTEAKGGQERMVLGESNPNLTGRILVIATVASLALLLYSRRRFVRLVVPFALPVMFIGVLMTKSRGATLSCGVSLLMGTLFGLRARIGTKLVFIMAVVGLLVGAFFVAGATDVLKTEDIFSRWEGGFGGATRSRAYIAETGFGLWSSSVKTMVVGVGYGMFHYAYSKEAGREQRFRSGIGRDPHNTWLKILTETGVLGVSIMAWLTIVLILSAARAAPGYAFVSWALVGLLAVATAKSSVDYHKACWYAIILVASIARLFPRTPRMTAEDPLLAEYHRARALS